MACASVVSPIEIFTADEVGRRRHWPGEDKIRIVEESLRGYRQGTATAHRYGISRSLLSIMTLETIAPMGEDAVINLPAVAS